MRQASRDTIPLILVVEDEALIAVELADRLSAQGFAVAGPFITCSEAETWLKESAAPPIAAILDNVLRDGPCLDLARDLRWLGIPFVVYSGHERSDADHEVFHDVPWITKPMPFETVVDAVVELLRAF